MSNLDVSDGVRAIPRVRVVIRCGSCAGCSTRLRRCWRS